MQKAAHLYSETVLGSSCIKQTPKFERAKIIITKDSAYCFISGTAAIIGEDSRNYDDIKLQTLQTVSLIKHLISEENLLINRIELVGKLKIEHLRIYVKRPHDFAIVQQILDAEFPGVNAFYVCACVCRDELLVEIEGIATA